MTGPAMSLYQEHARRYVKDFLKTLRIDVPIRSGSTGQYDCEGCFIPHAHDFYIKTFDEDRVGHKLIVALLTRDGILRFLIPNDKGVLEVHDLQEKPKVHEAIAKADKETSEGFQRLSDEREEFDDGRFKRLVDKVAKIADAWGAGDPPGSKGSDF